MRIRGRSVHAGSEDDHRAADRDVGGIGDREPSGRQRFRPARAQDGGVLCGQQFCGDPDRSGAREHDPARAFRRPSE